MTMTAISRLALAGLTSALLAATPSWADDAAKGDTATTAAETTKAEDTKADDKAASEGKAESKVETAAAAEPKYVVGDVVLGDANAPVTVIEYASFTCPHCASFHLNVWDKFKENYIDTGKVKFIMREVYFDKYGLWASMTARCAGPDGFYAMTDVYLKTQHVWTRSPDRAHAIRQVGRRAGVSDERLNACLSDRDYAKALLDDYKKNAAADDVRSTPTFVINGQKANGDMTYDAFVQLIDAAF